MADQRVILEANIADPTTPSQRAAVDASGRVSVSLAAASATVTVDSELPAAAALSDNFANPTAPAVGAFGMLWDGATWDRMKGDSTDGLLVNLGANNDVTFSGSVDTELPAAAALADNAANPTAPAVGAFNMVYDGATWDRLPGTSTDGALVNLGANNDVTVTGSVSVTGSVDTELPAAAALTDNFANPTAPGVGAFGMLWDGATWDRAAGNSVDGQLVNLGANNDVTVTGTVTVDTELLAAAALADATANPTITQIASYLMGYNGTTWDRVRTANTGRLQVDVVTGGGADTPTNPVDSYDTSSAIAAGATDNHDSADLGGTTKKLTMVHAGASVAMKCEIQSVINGVGTTLGVFFTQPGQSYTWKPPHRNFHSVAFSANAGFDGWRVIRTNLDASEAADVYSNIFYED